MKPVNLNKVRKEKARKTAKAKADANAVRFGLTKAQKRLAAQKEAQAVTRLDQHKRDKT